MNFNWKMIIFLAVLGAIVWINYRFKNVVVRGYNFFSQFPKLILIGLGVIIFCAPFLLKDNPLVNHVKDFLPDSMQSKIDKINEMRREQQIQYNGQTQEYQMPQYRGRGKGVTTKSLRKVSEQLKKQIAAQQGWKCKRCHVMLDATYEVDHIRALEDGGTNDITNLQALCRNCHGNKSLQDNIKRRYPGGRIQ